MSIVVGERMRRLYGPSEIKGPVHWCHACTMERVQFDFRKELQLCHQCERDAAEALERARAER
jgi:hypothetical protein